jgi:hypothetical protein
MSTNILDILSNMSGSTFLSIDTTTTVPLKGGKKNPMQGRVQKLNTSLVQVFQNKKINGYDAMVKRRLTQEGKDPNDFELKPRKWGMRVLDMPIVEHMKDGELRHYLEVIFVEAGKSEFFLDGVLIDKEAIIGLEPATIREDAQGGLENMVVIRSYALSSIDAIRYEGKHWRGPFYYEDKE